MKNRTSQTPPGQSDERLPPGLYVVATPIGNLGDITLRALSALRSAEVILCEDTRVTAKLLRHYGINARTEAYHEHNAARKRPEILAHLEAGGSYALVSDAGTPLISDPGYRLVREAREAGLRVEALPGASSVMTALAVAGLPTDRFLFAGFLPPKAGAAREVLEELANIQTTLVFFESPRRVAATLARMAEVLGGEREVAVARELTKLYEEVRRDTLAALAAHYAESEEPRGEIVLLVGPPAQAKAVDAAAVDAALAKALSHASLKEAVSAVAQAFSLPKNAVYARALELKASGR